MSAISIESAAESFRASLNINKTKVHSIGIAQGKIVVVLEEDIKIKPDSVNGFEIEWGVLDNKSVKIL